MYLCLPVAKSIIECVLPSEPGPSEVMANIRVISREESDKTSPANAENIPTVKPAKSKKTRFCRSVWKTLKHPFKCGKKRVTPFVPPADFNAEEILPDASQPTCPKLRLRSGRKAGTSSLGNPKTKSEFDIADQKFKAHTNPITPKMKAAAESAKLKIVNGTYLGVPLLKDKAAPKIKADKNPTTPNINAGAIPKVKAGAEPQKKTKNVVVPRIKTDTNSAIPLPTCATNPAKLNHKAGAKLAGPNHRVDAVSANPKADAGAIPKMKVAADPANPKLKAGVNPANQKLKTKPTTYTRSLQNKYYYDPQLIIGCGSFGRVYEGICKCDGQKVAIKRVKRNRVNRYLTIDGCPKPIPAEAAMMLKMRKAPISPYVVQMYDWFQDVQYVSFVLEYIDPSETLFNFINSQHSSRLTEETARRLMRQAVLAVKHCLEHGVFHTDLHSCNILVDRERMKLKLIDFGCAHIINKDGYNSKEFIGSLQYRPPEVFKMPKYFAMSTSVWSLGVLLYEMVHGHLPFPRGAKDAVIVIISNPLLSEEICDLITQCLSIKSTRRLVIWDILKHPWFKKVSTPVSLDVSTPAER